MSGFKVGDPVQFEFPSDLYDYTGHIVEVDDHHATIRRLPSSPTFANEWASETWSSDVDSLRPWSPPAAPWQVGDRVELIPERKQDRRIDRNGVRRFMHWPGGEVVSIASDGTAYIDRHESIPLSERRYYRVVQPEPKPEPKRPEFVRITADIPAAIGGWHKGAVIKVERWTDEGNPCLPVGPRWFYDNRSFCAAFGGWEPAEAPADTGDAAAKAAWWAWCGYSDPDGCEREWANLMDDSRDRWRRVAAAALEQDR